MPRLSFIAWALVETSSSRFRKRMDRRIDARSSSVRVCPVEGVRILPLDCGSRRKISAKHRPDVHKILPHISWLDTWRSKMPGIQLRVWPLLLALSVCVAFVVNRPQIRPASLEQDAVYVPSTHEENRAHTRRSILGASASSEDQQETYALVIDAGSSGSRIHVYKLRWQPGKQYPYVDLPDKCVFFECFCPSLLACRMPLTRLLGQASRKF
jgi:hypothetical protein